MSHYSNLNQDNKELKIYRPFGPSIGHCKLPQELIDDFNKDCEHLMDHKEKKKTHDFSDELVGNVKQELIISPETFAKWGTYFGKLMDAYIAAHPENHKELQKIVFKSFPLSSHKQAFKASKYAIDAGRQGKFKEMFKRIQTMSLGKIFLLTKNI